MKKAILLVLSNLFISGLLACSCGGPTTFCETLAEFENSNFEPLVVNAIISKKKDNGMDITIQNVLQGELTVDKVFVKSDNGAECIHYTNGFSKGDNYIFLLSEYYDDYALSFCHISFLKIENGILKGPIAPDIESLPYHDLASLESCDNQLNLFSISNSLAIFPNPTIDKIHIKNISEFETNAVFELEFFDVLGRNITFIKKEDGLQIEEEWSVDISDLAAGIYFLRFKSNRQKEVFRVVKL